MDLNETKQYIAVFPWLVSNDSENGERGNRRVETDAKWVAMELVSVEFVFHVIFITILNCFTGTIVINVIFMIFIM